MLARPSVLVVDNGDVVRPQRTERLRETARIRGGLLATGSVEMHGCVVADGRDAWEAADRAVARDGAEQRWMCRRHDL